MSASVRTIGYIGRHSSASLTELWKLIEDVKRDGYACYLLRSALRLYGIYEASDLENPLTQDLLQLCSEGQIFGETQELRWRKLGRGGQADSKFDVLMLSEKEVPVLESVGTDWEVELYAHNEAKEGQPISPAKLWNKPEARLPVIPEYPDELYLVYAVYRDPDTHAAQFTRLKAERK